MCYRAVKWWGRLIHGLEGRATENKAPPTGGGANQGRGGALGRRGMGGNKMFGGSSQGGLEWLYFWRPPGCLGGKKWGKGVVKKWLRQESADGGTNFYLRGRL